VATGFRIGNLKRTGDADVVQVIMITVDPARDSPRLMSQYVTSFDSRFIGLVTRPESMSNGT